MTDHHHPPSGRSWTRTGIYVEYQHAQGDFRFVEIDKAEAGRLVEYVTSEHEWVARQHRS